MREAALESLDGASADEAVGAQRACRISAPMSGILPLPTWLIILRIWSNCLTSWLTCWTFVPEPLRDAQPPRALDQLGLAALLRASSRG